MMANKKEKQTRIHNELKGFDIYIDEFGQIQSNLPIDKVNSFLNRNVDDKKLRDRDDINDIKRDSNN